MDVCVAFYYFHYKHLKLKKTLMKILDFILHYHFLCIVICYFILHSPFRFQIVFNGFLKAVQCRKHPFCCFNTFYQYKLRRIFIIFFHSYSRPMFLTISKEQSYLLIYFRNPKVLLISDKFDFPVCQFLSIVMHLL